jgi:hypothetical protein
MTMIKLDYLRERAAAYLRDAAATDDKPSAARFRMLAALCQELIRELEKSAAQDPEGHG